MKYVVKFSYILKHPLIHVILLRMEKWLVQFIFHEIIIKHFRLKIIDFFKQLINKRDQSYY